jgi:hypothetical protein
MISISRNFFHFLTILRPMQRLDLRIGNQQDSDVYLFRTAVMAELTRLSGCQAVRLSGCQAVKLSGWHAPADVLR